MPIQEYDCAAKLNYAFMKQKLSDYGKIILYCLENEISLIDISPRYIQLEIDVHNFENKILV